MNEKEYPLTFLQAMEAIINGKTVSNNHFPWYFFFLNEDGNIIEKDNIHGSGSINMYLSSDKITAKWRIEDKKSI